MYIWASFFTNFYALEVQLNKLETALSTGYIRIIVLRASFGQIPRDLSLSQVQACTKKPWLPGLVRLHLGSGPPRHCPRLRTGEESNRCTIKGLVATHTAVHATTKPSISIPAFASAVLAAIEIEAIQASIPSASITITKMSMVDLGKSSSLTDDKRACCTAVAMDRSSASCMLPIINQKSYWLWNNTYAHRCPSTVTRKGCKFHFDVESTLFAVCSVFWLSRPIAIRREISYSRRKENGLTLHMRFLLVQFQYMQNHLLGE